MISAHSSGMMIANTGTPLMWASGLHLLFGNLLIGIFEGWLVARIFMSDSRRWAIVMVAANYFSMIIGAIGLDPIRELLESTVFTGPPIFHAGAMLVVLALVSWFLSILLEWPACWWLVRKHSRPWWTALKASAMAQTASYALIAPFYASCTSISMITEPELQANLDFVSASDTFVYYIDPKNNAVIRCTPNGEHKQMVLALTSSGRDDRLFLDVNKSSKKLDLWWVHDKDKNDLLIPDIGIRGQLLKRDDNIEEGTWSNFRFFLNDPRESNWQARCGFWAADGVVVYREDNQNYRLAMETPFSGPFLWACRNQVRLSDTQVLFQCRDQLLILDMPSKKLGFLAMGRGPVVMFHEHEQERH